MIQKRLFQYLLKYQIILCLIINSINIQKQDRMSDDQHPWMRDDYDDQQLNNSFQSDDRSLSGAYSYISNHELKNEEEEDRSLRIDSDEQNPELQSDEDEIVITEGKNKKLQNLEALIKNENKITSKYMTKYQYAAILGKRAHQISKNSPLYVQIDQKQVKKYDLLQIAQMQLKTGKLPFLLRRLLPNGYYQDWKVADLQVIDQL